MSNTETNGALQKRSMRVAGHRTSLALEAEFWAALEASAKRMQMTLPVLVAFIDGERHQSKPDASLASAVRVHCLEHSPRPAATR